MPVAAQRHRGGDPGQALHGETADRVHQPQPGQAREQGDTGEEQRQQDQRRAQRAEQTGQAGPHQVAEHPPGVQREQRRVAEVQRAQAAARGQRQRETADPHDVVEDVRRRALLIGAAVEQPPAPGDQDGQQVGEIAEQVEQHVGEPGADAPALVHHAVDVTAVRPARIRGVVAGQRQHQIQLECAEQDQHGLARAAAEGPGPDQHVHGSGASRLAQNVEAPSQEALLTN